MIIDHDDDSGSGYTFEIVQLGGNMPSSHIGPEIKRVLLYFTTKRFQTV